MAAVARFLPWTYRFCWLMIFAIHGLVISYCCMIRWLYAFLPGTYLDQTFQYINLGLGTKHHATMGRIHVVVMLPHAFAVAMMVLGSIWARRLVFSLEVPAWASRTISGRQTSTCSNAFFQNAKRMLNFVYFHLMSQYGIFGVESKHFDDVLFVREAVETGFQTSQGYKMSWYLPRVWLNGSFVALLILNCWSTALAQLLFRGNEAKKRLVCLLCDSLLDLVCSVGIPTVVFLSYWRLYDPTIRGFAENLWHDDTFLVQVVSELQMVVVSSWMDLVSRAAFILGVYSSLSNIKELMQPPATTTNKVQHQQFAPPAEAVGPHAAMIQTSTSTKQPVTHTQFSGKLHGIVFGVWGLVVLVLHLHAESLAVAPNCLLQVRPWGITHPACSLVQTHCHNAGITGSAAELHDAWAAIEPSVVLRLVVVHCPALMIPPHIQQFTHLVGIKMYNSTILEWGTDAELNAASHQDLTFLHMVRLNVSNGDLPKGLQARAFPPKLFDLEFCITNIARLPQDLDQSWHQASTIYVENSQLDTFPEALVRLKPKHIGVGGNPIRTLPAGAFESPNLEYMSIGKTLITDLPDDVPNFSESLQQLTVSNTNLSFWYAWIDPMVGRTPYYPVLAFETPFCQELQEIQAGNRTGFSMTHSPSSRGMKLSHRLMEDLTSAEYFTYCGPVGHEFYPWTLDDAKYGLLEP